MKICFFGIYNAEYGRTSTLKEGLLRLGHTVHEIHEQVPNIRMELPEDYTVKTTVFRIFRKLKLYITLAKRAREVASCDLMVVLHPGHLDMPLAWVIAKLYKKPLFFDDSISPYDTMFVGRTIADRSSLKARLVKSVEHFLLNLADKVFVDTKRMKGFLHDELGIPNKKIFVVPLGANDTVYSPSKKITTNDQCEVLFFGLYNPMHGAPTILDAAKILKKSSIHFTMLGDGYLKDSLMEQAKQEQLTNVTFVGLMPEKELVSRIQKSDIVLGVFSHSPVFERVIPNKVFGALACAKAVVTASRSAVSEYLKDGVTAKLCEPENAESLAKAISELAKFPKKRESIAKNGYDLYLQTGTPEQIAHAFLKQGGIL